MNTLTTILFLLQTTGTTGEAAPTMTIGGWVFMAGAWIFIISLTYYTFAKILRGDKK